MFDKTILSDPLHAGMTSVVSNHIGCHGVDTANEQKIIWNEYCSKPISKLADIELYLQYCISNNA